DVKCGAADDQHGGEEAPPPDGRQVASVQWHCRVVNGKQRSGQDKPTLSPTRKRGMRVPPLACASGSKSTVDEAAFFLLLVVGVVVLVVVAAADGDRAGALRRVGFDSQRLDVLLAV